MKKLFAVFLILAVTAVALLLWNRKKPSRSDTEAIKPTPTSALTVAPSMSSTSATLSGVVAVVGAMPVQSKNPAASFRDCNQGEIGDRHKMFRGANGRLQNVFVYIKDGIQGSYPAPKDPVMLDQDRCAYLPRVLGVQVGQPLLILNSDDTLHNVHAMPKNSTAFNAGMPMKELKLTKTFGAPEVMVPIKCDVHPWMRAYVGVLPHPFFDVSKEDGSFSIQRVPAGEFTVETWHEKLGTQTATVSLAAGETRSLTFSFSIK
jgi:plastocyanin